MTRGPQRLDRLRQTAMILLFAVLLMLPLADYYLRFAPAPTLSELRPLAKRPALEWNLRSLRKFPAAYEAYFNDFFGFRNLLTYAYNWMKFFWLKDSPIELARVGEDGWLYFGKPDETTAFQRLNPFTEPELERLTGYFAVIQSWLADRGATFVIMIPPNKSTLYPEHMPRQLRRADGLTRLDQFVSRSRARGLTVVDLRDTFEQEKPHAPVYYRLDAHWSPYGALLGCRELMKALTPDGSVPADLADIRWTTNEGRYTSADMATLMGLNHVLTEPLVTVNWTSPTPIRFTRSGSAMFGGTWNAETDLTNAPVAVFFRDSFAELLLDPLAAHFSRLVAVWTYGFQPDVVEQWKPDVVVFEFVERILNVPDSFGNLSAMVGRLLSVQLATDSHRLVGANVVDPSALLGFVRHVAPPAPRGWLMFGRYTTLPPGRHVATFCLKAGTMPTQPVARLDVSTAHGTRQLASTVVDASTLQATGTWTTVSLPFEVSSADATSIEYRVEYLGGCDLSIDYVKVAPGDATKPDGDG